MLPGQYAELDGLPVQIVRVIASSTLGPNGMPTRATEYELAPLDGGPWHYVTDPSSTQLVLGKPCEVCDLPAGYSGCAARGGHDGPPKLHRPERKPVEVSPWASSARHGTSCSCWRWDCSECGWLMHQAQRLLA